MQAWTHTYRIKEFDAFKIGWVSSLAAGPLVRTISLGSLTLTAATTTPRTSSYEAAAEAGIRMELSSVASAASTFGGLPTATGAEPDQGPHPASAGGRLTGSMPANSALGNPRVALFAWHRLLTLDVDRPVMNSTSQLQPGSEMGQARNSAERVKDVSTIQPVQEVKKLSEDATSDIAAESKHFGHPRAPQMHRLYYLR
jgi:hypothetical protein